MEKEFVNYNQALALKKLGFNEPCIAIYSNANPKTGLYTLKKYRLKLIKQASQKDKGVKAPTWQSAFRWFREKYKLEGFILPQNQGAVIDEEPIYFIAIISYKNNNMEELFNSTNKETLLHYNPKEEAELACLEKMVEILKTKQQEQ